MVAAEQAIGSGCLLGTWRLVNSAQRGANAGHCVSSRVQLRSAQAAMYDFAVGLEICVTAVDTRVQ